MKKYNLLKAIGIVMCLFLLLTWIIPGGVFTNGVFTKTGHEPVGLFDLILAPLNFFNWSFVSKQLLSDGASIQFMSYTGIILALLAIGIFYKVLNKTGAYGKLIEDIIKKIKDKKEIFIICTTVFFTLFSAITGLSLLAFLLVPFFVTVLLKLKYSKITTLGSTILPILVGRIVAITAGDITGISNVVFGLKVTTDLAFKLILLIIFTVTLVFYVLYSKSSKNETEEDPLYDNIVVKEKSYAPILMLTALFFIIMVVFMYNWYYVFEFASLTNAYESMMSTTIGGYPIASNIFGMMEPFGYWTGFTMSAMLILLSLVISFIYSISFEDIIDSAKEGTKKMSRVAIYVVLACSVMVILSNNNSNILFTINNWIHGNLTKAAVPFTAIVSGIYSFFVNDFFAVSSPLSNMLSTYFTGDNLSLSVLTMQFMHGLVSIVTPTSIFLVAGLAYLEIPYKKWIAYIWKFCLIVLAVGLLLLLLVSMI
jgi:Predicted membrane protein